MNCSLLPYCMLSSHEQIRHLSVHSGSCKGTTSTYKYIQCAYAWHFIVVCSRYHSRKQASTMWHAEWKPKLVWLQIKEAVTNKAKGLFSQPICSRDVRMGYPVPTKVVSKLTIDIAMLFCTHPPNLSQNLSPKDIAGSDIIRWNLQMASLVKVLNLIFNVLEQSVNFNSC